MKKYIIFISIVFVFLIITTVLAGNESNGQPFQVIWDAINSLQEQVKNIQLIPGPQGPVGPQGPQGEKGEPGQPSWDEARIVALETDISNLTAKVDQIWNQINCAEGEKYDYLDLESTNNVYIYEEYWEGQTFTASDNYIPTSIKLLLGNHGGGSFTVFLKNTADDLPTPDILCSGSINVNTLPESFVWREINLSNCPKIIKNIKYAIVVKSDYATFNWRGVNPDSYFGGTMVNSNDSGNSWIIDINYDFLFEVWGKKC